jgi:hypothetical protein
MDELGYAKCPEGFRRAHESGRVKRGDKEPEWLSRQNPHNEFGDDIVARVMACHGDGHKPKTICDMLNGLINAQLTTQQVHKMIKDNEKKQEAAA